MANEVKVIGLVGGIGSGKSTAAAVLAELGALVIDADRLGHEAYAPGTPGFEGVVEAFGSEIVGPEGAIDRARLGACVFGDPHRLRQLEAIVHPLIHQSLVAQIDAARLTQAVPAVVVEAAILFEAGWAGGMDEVWVVCAPREAVEKRLASQRGLGAEAVAMRRARQMSDEERRKRAGVVIENEGTEADLRARVEGLWRDRIAGPV